MDHDRGVRRQRGSRAASWGRRAAVLAALVGVLLLAPAPARAGGLWGWSPGVKLGWTFGYGLTYGIEISFIHLPELDLHGNIWDMTWQAFGQVITRTYGIVVNIDTDFKRMFKMRVGAEWVGPMIGLEAGPMFVKDRHGAHFGIGITPWIGYTLFGYYTFTLICDKSPNLHEIGLYLKAPLLGFGSDGWAHDDDWDD